MDISDIIRKVEEHEQRLQALEKPAQPAPAPAQPAPAPADKPVESSAPQQ